MVWFQEIDKDAAERAQKALALPIGAASPLWAAYAGMTAAGVGLWWMSQWAKPMNLEAMSGKMFPDFAKLMPEMPGFAPMTEALAAMQPEPVALAPEADIEALEPVMAAAEPVLDVADTLAASVEAAETAAPIAPDDLTQLVGIGPTLAAKLADMGVTRFAQIAAWGEEDIDRFDKALKLIGRVKRENWIGQATQLAEG